MIVLLDSTILIDALRGRNDRSALLDRLVVDRDVLVTSVVNVGEVYAGMRPSEEARTIELFSALKCYPVTEAIARHAGELKNYWARKGRTLELADMMVAATALEIGATLMTDNRKDFPVDGLMFQPLS